MGARGAVMKVSKYGRGGKAMAKHKLVHCLQPTISGMFSAMGNLCYNSCRPVQLCTGLLAVDLCLKFVVLQKLAFHRSPFLSEMAAAGLNSVSNPNPISAQIVLLVFKCGRGQSKCPSYAA
jgi:hypothetical protein